MEYEHLFDFAVGKVYTYGSARALRSDVDFHDWVGIFESPLENGSNWVWAWYGRRAIDLLGVVWRIERGTGILPATFH